MALTTAQIQNAYVAFFNRPADNEGLRYWGSYAGSSADLLNTFAQSAEYKSLYSGMNNTQLVNAVYQNLFGHAPDVKGLEYWVDNLSTGKLSIGNIADAINKGALSTDATIIANKVAAATAFTAALDTTAEEVAYAGVNSTGLTAVKAWLAAVSSDATTIPNTDSINTVITTVLNNVASTGSTFTLTANADNVVGTAANDSIGGSNNATQTTFSAIDSIDGGAGVDTLNLDLSAAYTGGATVKNVEKINLTSSNGSFNAVGITGLTDFNVNAGAAAVITNLGNVVNVGVSNVSNQVSQFNIVETAVGGSTDAVTLTVNNVTAGLGNADIDLQTTTNLGAGIETVNIVSKGVANTIRLGTNDATVSKITVSGDQNLTLTLGTAANSTTIQTSASTIDATGFTGKLNVSGMGLADHTVTGGSGADTINFGANFAAGDVVDGGNGTDTLAVTLAITAAQWAGVKNVEAVAFTMGASVTQDASLLTGVNAFSTSGAFTQTLTNLAAAPTLTVAAATTTLTASLKDVTGLSDAVTLNLNPASGATANLTLGTLSDIAGLEQLNLVANGSSKAIVNTITTDNVTAKHVVTGAGSLTINGSAASLFDATGLKGDLKLATSLSTAVNYQAGEGADSVAGGAAADTIVGNAGNDVLIGLAGADILKGGAGADKFVLGAAAGLVSNIGANVDVITDFVAGTDKIAFDVAGNLLAGANGAAASALTGANAILKGVTFSAATAAMSALGTVITDNTSVANISAVYTQLGVDLPSAAEFAGSNASGTATVARVVTFTAGAAAGTYLVINDSTAGFAAADDVVINITGLSGTLSASDFVFA